MCLRAVPLLECDGRVCDCWQVVNGVVLSVLYTSCITTHFYILLSLAASQYTRHDGGSGGDGDKERSPVLLLFEKMCHADDDTLT